MRNFCVIVSLQMLLQLLLLCASDNVRTVQGQEENVVGADATVTDTDTNTAIETTADTESETTSETESETPEIINVGLGQKFGIREPTLEYNSLEFELDFLVSDFIEDSMIGYVIYDGLNCRYDNGGDNDITDNDEYPYLISRLRTDLSPIGIGLGERSMKITAELIPDLLENSAIYTPIDDGSRAKVEFCIRFSTYNSDQALETAVEVDFLEKPIILNINLAGGLSIEANLSDADRVVQQSYQDAAVEAYLCDSTDNLLTVEEIGSKIQGSTVRVCVSPYSNTMLDGAFIKALEDFTFYRPDNDVSQVAIKPNTGGEPADQLTVVNCPPGSSVCAFETLLAAKFFTNGAGIVRGNGSAFLQLGRDEDAAVARKTRTRNRNLQQKSYDEQLSERPTKYNVAITILPVDKVANKASYSGAIQNNHMIGVLLLQIVVTTSVLLLSVIPLF